ncbi:MAG TPA: 6-pyruvoyl-tetrahydropterin synthase-related protein, partial [Chloroflexota bacterium]|nr:6-pyruvoyl-tetrahydropterin synthase-related protein [Chloroflexota bacterium]
MELDNLWTVGEFYPRLAPDLAIGYDYPVFNYYAPLGLYLGEFFRLVGLRPVRAMEATYAASIVGAAWSMRLFLGSFLPRVGAFLGALSFCFLPYLLLDVYVRGALAEALGLAALPFVLWSTRRLALAPDVRASTVAGLALASLVLIHNITALLAVPLIGIYWLVTLLSSDPRQRWSAAICAALSAIVLGLTLSAFYWVPALAELTFISADRASTGFFDYQQHLQSLRQIFGTSPTYEYHVDFSLLFRVGLVQVILTIAGLVAVLRTTGWRRREGVFWGVMAASAVFLMSTRSSFLWEHIPLLAYAQFPWRWLSIVGVASSVLVGYLGSVAESRWRALNLAWVGILAVIVVVSAVSDLKPDYLDLRDVEVRSFTVQQMERAFNYIDYSPGEYLPRGAATSGIQDRSNPGLSGADAVTVRSAGPFFLDLTVDASRDAPVILDRFFFPGWYASIDDQPVATRASGPQGLLTIDVPSGNHRVQVWFGSTQVRLFAAIVSALALFALAVTAAVAVRRRVARPARSPVSRQLDLAVTLGWLGTNLNRLPTILHTLACAFVLIVIVLGVREGLLHSRSAQASIPVVADFGDAIRLAGATFGDSSEFGTDLTLYWQARRPVDRDFAVRIRVVDSAGRVVGERTKPPDFGLRSTSLWVPGQIVRDNVEVSRSEGASAIGDEVFVDLIDPTTGTVIPPVTSNHTDGIGVSLGTFPVNGPTPTLTPTGASANFSDKISLDYFQIQRLSVLGSAGSPGRADTPFFVVGAGERLGVHVRWRSLQDVSDNFTVSVQLLDRHGSLVSQVDDWPRHRFYPTILWRPGEVIPDDYVLPVPIDVPTGLYDLKIGLYRLGDLKRLPLVGGPTTANQASLGAVKVVRAVIQTGQLSVGQTRHDAVFGNEVALLGHDLRLASSEPGAGHPATVPAGSRLAVTLYWQARQRPTN